MRWLAVLTTLIWCFPALAGVVWVPSPPLVADGTTATAVRFYVDDGQKIKVKAEGGKIGGAVGGPDGVWTVPFTPSRVTAAGTVNFKITAGGVESSFDIPVVPVFSGSLKVTFDPAVLPATGTATVRIEPSGSSPVAAEGRRFLLTASAGTVEAVTPTGSGAWVARYTPPKGLTAPLAVVFGAADAGAPDKVYGTAVLPVTARKSITLDVQPGSSNVLTVGGRQYGPTVAAPNGKVAFDVDLDPRERTGDLKSVNPDTSRSDRTVDLPVAASTSLAFLPMPASVPARADVSVPVRVVVVGADGKPRSDAQVKLSSSKGSVSAATWDREAYTATFTPPAASGEVTITAEVDGVKAERKLLAVGTVPSITLSTTPTDIPKTGTTFTVTARVKDAQGTGVVGRPPILTVTGATSAGSVKDNKDGSYSYPYKVASSVNLVRVFAAPALDTSSMPAARLIAWPTTPTVAANGTDTVTINVVTVDAYGLPVPNVALKVGAPRGDGSVPPSATTDGRGMARLTFTAGRAAGVASVRVEGAGITTEVPLFQTKDGAGAMLPLGGDESTIALWQAAAPELKVLREGVVPPAGPPATVAITTVPPYTTPGAAILVTIRVNDAAGAGVGGKKLAISASPATVGQITDNRDGTYAVPLQLPAGVDGPILITVGADSATGTVNLPTLATLGSQPVATSGGSRPTTGGGGGGGGGTVKRPAPATAEWAKLRVGGALVNSRGTYTMSSDAGAQLLGAASYSTPGAGFWGLSVDGVWLPLQASWGGLGLDVRAGSQLEWFSVGKNPYVNLQRDVIGGARYRRGLGGLFSIEASLAAHYTTGVLFRYADAARSKVSLLNFPLVGARLGVLGSLESEKVYVNLELAETFAPFPIDTHAAARLDYKISDGGTALRVGGGWDYRSMKYEAGTGQEKGTAQVGQSQFNIQLGVTQVM